MRRQIQQQTVLEVDGVEDEKGMVRLLPEIFFGKEWGGWGGLESVLDRRDPAGGEGSKLGEFRDEPSVDEDQSHGFVGL